MKDHAMTPDGRRRGRVLLAEDDLEMRRMVAWSLEHAGYEVRECANGTTLLRALAGDERGGGRGAYDLVISDIRMPGYTGLEVLASVRAFDDCPPVLLVSAFADPATIAEAEALGAVTLVPKPFDVGDLLDRVRALMPQAILARQDALDDEPAAELAFPLTVEYRHTDAMPPVEDFIRQLAAKLDRHGGEVQRCRVTVAALSEPGASHRWYEVKVQVQTHGGGTCVVERTSQPDREADNLYLALQMAFAAAHKQITRKRGRRRERPAHRRAAAMAEIR
ncbi:MAG: response regulator [Candidatus Krumholzibacteriia bacterium]